MIILYVSFCAMQKYHTITILTTRLSIICVWSTQKLIRVIQLYHLLHDAHHAMGIAFRLKRKSGHYCMKKFTSGVAEHFKLRGILQTMHKNHTIYIALRRKKLIDQS
jgi:hypothetical protein